MSYYYYLMSDRQWVPGAGELHKRWGFRYWKIMSNCSPPPLPLRGPNIDRLIRCIGFQFCTENTHINGVSLPEEVYRIIYLRDGYNHCQLRSVSLVNGRWRQTAQGINHTAKDRIQSAELPIIVLHKLIFYMTSHKRILNHFVSINGKIGMVKYAEEHIPPQVKMCSIQCQKMRYTLFKHTCSRI